MKKKKQKLGDCYYANGQLFLKLVREAKSPQVEYRMCHGIATHRVDGKPMGHAWVECIHSLGDVCNTTVRDHSNGSELRISRDSYYVIGDIKEVIRYTFKEFNSMLLANDTWGHWELNVNR